jgi:hypothetical protein
MVYPKKVGAVMAGRTTAVRAEALRKARELRVARELERKQLDDQLDAALADLLESSSKAQSVRENARARADELIAKGEVEAVGFEMEAAKAVRLLRKLGQTNAQIAEFCGVSVGGLRGMLALTRDDDASSDASGVL